MDATVRPAPLSGAVKAIGSKSDIHRLLICAAMAEGRTEIDGIVQSDDVLATVSCIKALGANVEIIGDKCAVSGGNNNENPHLDCGESGSTLRFMLPVVAATCGSGSFEGRGRLPQRPLGELVSAMKSGGVSFDKDTLPMRISGRLRSGEYSVPGNISSQYITGLLMALSVTEGRSEILLTSCLESSAYVDMTLDTLRKFGADIKAEEDRYIINGKKRLTSPGVIRADGDWSNAAFFLASGAINGCVTVTGLRENSVQGDKRIVDILRRFGADVTVNGDSVTVTAKSLKGCTVDVTNIPDLLPILAVAAAFSDGETRFTGAARLRMKESDRLRTVHDMIASLGGEAVELPDGLIVTGRKLTEGTVNGANDHRIVMAASIAAAHADGEVTITGAEAINKSYPGFFGDMRVLGGQCDVI